MVRRSYNNKLNVKIYYDHVLSGLEKFQKFGKRKIKCTSSLLKKIEYEVAASLSVSAY